MPEQDGEVPFDCRTVKVTRYQGVARRPTGERCSAVVAGRVAERLGDNSLVRLSARANPLEGLVFREDPRLNLGRSIARRPSQTRLAYSS